MVLGNPKGGWPIGSLRGRELGGWPAAALEDKVRYGTVADSEVWGIRRGGGRDTRLVQCRTVRYVQYVAVVVDGDIVRMFRGANYVGPPEI